MIAKIIKSAKVAFRKGAQYIIIGSFLTKFVAFFGSVFLIRFLTKDDYGILTYYENFYGYFLLFSGMGFAYGLQRYIIISDSLPEKKGIYQYSIKRGECYNFLLFAVFSLLCVFYSHPAEFKSELFIGVILSAIIPFQYLLTLNLSALRGLFDYKAYAALAFFTSAFFVVCRVVGAIVAGLHGTVFFRLSAEFLCAILSTVYVHHHYFRSADKRLRRDMVKPLNAYSLQLMITDGLWALFMLNDVFLLSRLSGNATVVAEYKTASVIPGNLSLISAAIGVFVAPLFTKKENDADFKWVMSNFRSLQLITFGLVFVAVVFCMVFAKQIIVILFGSQYLEMLSAFRILLVSSLLNNGVRYTIANVFSAIGLQKRNLFVATTGVVLQVAMDLLLIPKYGLIGVSYSNVIVQFIMSAILIIELNTNFKKWRTL